MYYIPYIIYDIMKRYKGIKVSLLDQVLGRRRRFSHIDTHFQQSSLISNQNPQCSSMAFIDYYLIVATVLSMYIKCPLSSIKHHQCPLIGFIAFPLIAATFNLH